MDISENNSNMMRSQPPYSVWQSNKVSILSPAMFDSKLNSKFNNYQQHGGYVVEKYGEALPCLVDHIKISPVGPKYSNYFRFILILNLIPAKMVQFTVRSKIFA